MNDRRAVIDIGSNTVRLAIFSAPSPDHHRLVDEKARCRLADGLDRTGRLSPAGIALATQAITGYFSHAARYGVDTIEIVATAAVREAADGPDFAKAIETEFSTVVRILDEEEEARLSALGVISGRTHLVSMNGLTADLGGGSLELAEVMEGRIGRTNSLPLGHIRLGECAGDDCDRLDSVIAETFEQVPWLGSAPGDEITVTGGAFRKLAREHMAQTGVELGVDGYAMDAISARRFAGKLIDDATFPGETLESTVIASRLILGLFDASQAACVLFSSRGLMDGCHAAHHIAGAPAA